MAFDVMIVEDNEDHAFLMRRFIARSSIDVSVTHETSAEDAIANIQSAARPPDLMMVDMSLPGMDGVDLLRYAKGREALRAVPIVIMTTSDSAEDRRRAMRAYANSYVSKPADSAAFESRLTALLHYWKDVHLHD